MSITPIMESSAFELRRSEEQISKKKSVLSRQGSYGSEEETNSVENDFRATESGQQQSHRTNNSPFTKIIENTYFQIFITILTVITLLLYDIKTIAFSKDQDFAIGVLNCIFFSLFMGEIAMNIKTQGYFCSFFFFLDLVSTITILFDVDFIIDGLFHQSPNAQVSSFVAKSKASRVAARAVRVVKIFRLTRVAKLYKSAQRAKDLNDKSKLEILQKENNRFKNKRNFQNDLNGNNIDEYSNYSKPCITKKALNTTVNIDRYDLQNDSIKEDNNLQLQKPEIFLNERSKATKSILQSPPSPSLNDIQPQQLQNRQSQISKILTEDTVKKIVIIILLIMISIPLLDINNYDNISTQWDYSINFIANALVNPNVTIDSISQLVALQIASFDQLDTKATFICIDSPFAVLSTCSGIDLLQFRSADLGVFIQTLDVTAITQIRPNLSNYSNQNIASSLAIFVNYQSYNSIDSGFSIATTTFICLTIIYLLSEFSSNINQLVIIPIEKMLNLIRAKDYREEEKEEGVGKEEEYETKLVQMAIIKIKALMETIYGPLGNDLIQERMLNNKSISANLQDSMKKSFCVAALCRLNHISKITEVLGEDVFGFLNEIALIVHNAAFKYGGYCTKILDHGFLIIFKIPEEEIEKQKIEEDIDPIQLAKSMQKTTQTYINNFCDFSVYFALKTIARIVKEPKLFKYRNDQRLLISFGGVASIEMNFAFTMGWCYEAVIGSSHKIDPLFLGEEINHLERVIKISKNYSNSILMTDSLYDNLSSGLKYHSRPFETLKFSENQPEKTLHIMDYDTSNVTPSVNRAEKSHKDARDLKMKKEMNMIYLSGLLSADKSYNANTFISSKKQLSQILKKSSGDETRRKKYQLAYEKYLKGQWFESQQLLQNQNLKNDIPSQRLYNFLYQFHFRSPLDWQGYREYSSLFDRS